VTRRFALRAASPEVDRLDDAWRMASILVGSKSPADRIGLRRAMGIDVPTDAPRAPAARSREADLVEAACRTALSRLDGALLDQLHRILANGATRLGPIVDGALADVVRRGLGPTGDTGLSTPSIQRGDLSFAPSAAHPDGGERNGADAPHEEHRTTTAFSAVHDAPYVARGHDAGEIAFTGPLVEAKERTPVDERVMVAALGSGGAVATVLDGFQERAGQVKMARAVTRAMNDGLKILVEAGTGTGKTMAYLLPAAMHAVQNGRSVVISTHTIALQDQLVNKDVPVMRRALDSLAAPTANGTSLRVAVLKGRTNYLCIRRWRRFLVTCLAGETERFLAARIAVWVASTATGDRNELALNDAETAIWSASLGADVLYCTGKLCAENRSGRCWVARARRRAANSHLVIVNHALLLTDLATAATGERGILPKYAEAIIDEAHHLEAVATDHLGAEVATRDLVNALGALSIPMGGTRFGGSIARIGATYVEVGGQYARDTVGDLTGAVHAMVAAAREAVGPFREALGAVIDARQQSGADGPSDREVRLVPPVRRSDGWAAASEAWEGLSHALREASRAIGQFKEAFDPYVGTSETVDDAVVELEEAIVLLDETRAVTARVVLEPSDDEVAWISLDRFGAQEAGTVAREVRLHAAPLHVDRQLQALLFERLDSVVLTSATIRVDGTFRHARTCLGLGSNVHVLAVGSPFDYASQALLVVPRDLPDPGSPTSASVLHDLLVGIASAMGGRTLVLFTSYSSLRAAHAALSRALPHLVVLGQGIDGARGVLLERFRATPNAILLGTSSFWEGIDVTGEALSCLVIVKIPFTVPSDPVFAARSELLEDPFSELAVPQAVVRMRQGFGRLIRTTSDRGIVVVLDSRMVTRRYGQTFFDSLPPATRRVCAVREVVPIVEAWWTGSKTASLGAEGVVHEAKGWAHP
jgi:Rad3-related DNA helicase